MVVDPRFEEVVETGELLSLSYASAQARARWGLKDASRIGKLLDAEVILLIEAVRGGVRFQHQALSLDSGVARPVGAAVSNAGEATLR